MPRSNNKKRKNNKKNQTNKKVNDEKQLQLNNNNNSNNSESDVSGAKNDDQNDLSAIGTRPENVNDDKLATTSETSKVVTTSSTVQTGQSKFEIVNENEIKEIVSANDITAKSVDGSFNEPESSGDVKSPAKSSIENNKLLCNEKLNIDSGGGGCNNSLKNMCATTPTTANQANSTNSQILKPRAVISHSYAYDVRTKPPALPPPPKTSPLKPLQLTSSSSLLPPSNTSTQQQHKGKHKKPKQKQKHKQEITEIKAIECDTVEPEVIPSDGNTVEVLCTVGSEVTAINDVTNVTTELVKPKQEITEIKAIECDNVEPKMIPHDGNTIQVLCTTDNEVTSINDVITAELVKHDQKQTHKQEITEIKSIESDTVGPEVISGDGNPIQSLCTINNEVTVINDDVTVTTELVKPKEEITEIKAIECDTVEPEVIPQDSNKTQVLCPTDNEVTAINDIITPESVKQDYRVESPKVTLHENFHKFMQKSRSLDSEDILIQEMSDSGSQSGDNENTPIISEAESEVEDEKVVCSNVNFQIIPFDGPLVDLSAEEEILIKELESLEPSTSTTAKESNELKLKRARKRAAIESHFLPQFLNPKFLDVIKEENSDTSDAEGKKSQPLVESSKYDDLDDDVFIDSSAISKKANAVFPKSNLDFSTKHRRLAGTVKDVIREEPQCVLVDTKIVDLSVEGSCSNWTTSLVPDEERSAELVYLASSSTSSASDICDADVEDSTVVDAEVRIETPTIGSVNDVPNFTNLNEILSEIDENLILINKCDTSDHLCDNNDNFVTNSLNEPSNLLPNTNHDIPSSISDDPQHTLIGKNTIPNTNDNLIDTKSNNEFNRQDSSGSLCSSTHSHSTSQSQCTARYCATSPPRILADFEQFPSVSGANYDETTEAHNDIKTLRHICLEKLASMPYGNVILEELANVAESLSELTNKHQLAQQRPEKSPTPPPRPPNPDETMPYPHPNLPHIEGLEVQNSERRNFVTLSTMPPASVKSPPPPPIPELPKVQSWLGMPTQTNPNVLVCLSPSQRDYLSSKNDANPDLLLEMHKNFVERRGYHEYSANQLKEIERRGAKPVSHHFPPANVSDENDDSYVGDDNRLLAIIRDLKQEECSSDDVKEKTQSEASPMATIDQTNGKPIQTKLSDFEKRFSNIEKYVLGNPTTTLTSMSQPKRYSNIETETFETHKRTENGSVIFEFSDMKKEKSTNNDDSRCISQQTSTNENRNTIPTTSATTISQPSSSSSPSAAYTQPKENYENSFKENSLHAKSSVVDAKSEFFDHEKFTFKEFDYVPKFSEDFKAPQFPSISALHQDERAKEFFQSNVSSSTELNQSPLFMMNSPLLHNWTQSATNFDDFVDNITKPISREENLCRGRASNIQVRAPRMTAKSLMEIDGFDETPRQYDASTQSANIHTFWNFKNRQSMIDQTPITPYVSATRRRKSLPKELHVKQLEYIRQKEEELSSEFDKLEHDRRNLLKEIEEMRVNQTFADIVAEHKRQSSEFVQKHLSETEKFRQKMHNEWLDKVAQREERRLQKIIKISKPFDDNVFVFNEDAHNRTLDIGDEFLNRVKERRTKLKMPSDSDCESGAESQPVARAKSEQRLDPTIKIIEGQTEKDLASFPKHLKEFASEFTTTSEQHDEQSSKISKESITKSSDQFKSDVKCSSAANKCERRFDPTIKIIDTEKDLTSLPKHLKEFEFTTSSEEHDENSSKSFKKTITKSSDQFKSDEKHSSELNEKKTSIDGSVIKNIEINKSHQFKSSISTNSKDEFVQSSTSESHKPREVNHQFESSISTTSKDEFVQTSNDSNKPPPNKSDNAKDGTDKNILENHNFVDSQLSWKDHASKVFSSLRNLWSKEELLQASSSEQLSVPPAEPYKEKHHLKIVNDSKINQLYHQQETTSRNTTVVNRRRKELSKSSSSSQNNACCNCNTAITPPHSNCCSCRQLNTFAHRRRSLSEGDLLHEIDKALVLSKGFLFAQDTQPVKMFAPKFKATAPSKGIWSPTNNTDSQATQQPPPPPPASQPPNHPSTEQKSSSISITRQSSLTSQPPTPPPPPFWAPKSVESSPTFDRKEFRPIKFESPKTTRKVYTKQDSETSIKSSGTTATTTSVPPWSYPLPDKIRLPQSQSNFEFNTNSSNSSHQLSSSLPKTQYPTSTFLQKTRVEGQQFPRSNSYVEIIERQKIPQQNQSPVVNRPNEITHTIKHDFLNEKQDSENERKVISTEQVQHQQQQQSQQRINVQQQQLPQPESNLKKVEGIGPITKEGMPIVLRSEVDENNHHKWYKRMYNTLHKVHQDDDYVTVRYKTRRGRYPYKSSGYLSEPEPNYDSDYSIKYSTLDRRRAAYPPTSTSFTDGAVEEKYYGTMPNPIKCGSGIYKNQPGRIENYVTGHSSVSEKERKEWVEENSPLPYSIKFARAVDKFHLEHERVATRNYSEGYLSRALKDQGYESDSTLVFRKNQQNQLSQLSPDQQKQAYLNLQSGGEAPLQGFRKLAPEKPKDIDDDDEEFEYFPITQTLTKIRVNNRNNNSAFMSTIQPQREILCYPITNITRPLDLFGPFPKTNQSFVPTLTPPTPPNRKSSKLNSTLKIFSKIQATSKNGQSSSINTGTITLRKSRLPTESNRSKSASSLLSTFSTASATLKEEKNFANHSRVASRRQIQHRVSSVSPLGRRSGISSRHEQRKLSASPIAFGRSISKERTFAEEKKKLEERLPLCRKSFTASTSILRDPDLKSPDQVKRAVQTTFKLPQSNEKFTATKTTRKISTGGTVKTSDITYTSNKSERGTNKNDEKSLRVTVALNSPNKRQTRPSTPVSIKSQTTARSSRKTSENHKYSSQKTTRATSRSTSNLSLARTSSTYSIDSITSSKRKTGKPLTITKSSARAESATVSLNDQKNKKKKAGSKEAIQSGSQLQSNEVIKFSTFPRGETAATTIKSLEQQFHENINEAILSNPNRSDTFFQQLFLRDVDSPTPSLCSSYIGTSVQEKARLWDSPQPKRQLKHQSLYLAQKCAVTGSKFTELDRCRRQSRSLSPQRIFRPKRLYNFNHVSKYDSFYQKSSDEENEFGLMNKDRLTELTYKFEERSKSQPASSIFFTEVVSPPFPVTIHGKQQTVEVRSESPARDIRSPSCRRIQSFKANQRVEEKRIARARSLGATDRYNSLDSKALSRSVCTLDENCYENHAAVCSHRKSDRFKDLNKFYNTVERVGQLERATSSTDLHPIRKEGEIIDFDVWKQVREHEKAEKELNVLVGKLKRDEKEKDFLFRPRYYEDSKWHERRDSGLRIKEKSVENLKHIFNEKSQQDELDYVKQQEIDATKDNYKPLWRGNSVLDLASSMVCKYNPADKTSVTQQIKSIPERRYGISQKLISTLSRDQISKIKNQLSEIYSNNFGAHRKSIDEPISDKFIIDVGTEPRKKGRTLTVRSNSLVSKEQLLTPVLKRQQARLLESYKAESIGSIHEPRQSRSVERYEDVVKHEERKFFSDAEKRSIFHNISRELQDKINEKKQIMSPKETRGAIASDNARNTLNTPSRACSSLQYLSVKKMSKDEHRVENKSEKKSESKLHAQPQSLMFFDEPVVQKLSGATAQQKQPNDTETLSSEASKQTVILKEDSANIQNKIEYFEKKKEETPEKTIYHAREYSSPDEEEIMKVIEEKMKIKKEEQLKAAATSAVKSSTSPERCLSSSVSDFKEIFGEKVSAKNTPRIRTPSPDSNRYLSPNKVYSNSTSIESVFRSRSVSPQYEKKNYKTYFNIVRTGDVRKMKDKFESLTYSPSRYNSIDGSIAPRRFRSDPDLNKIKRTSSPCNKVLLKQHEAGDVSWITHKFETRNSASRGRSRSRKISSPIPKVPFKKDDRFMPHIDIISKTASLKQEIRKKSPAHDANNILSGEVQKIKNKFESPDRLSLLGQMYTSSPDISELKDISSYLSGSWVAHKYPKAGDNARSPVSPERGPVCEKIKKRKSHRPSSSSPPRIKSSNVSSILKPFYDIFADSEYDPRKHRPTHRYVPDRHFETEYLWRRLQHQQRKAGIVNSLSKPCVKFEDTEVNVPPPPPIKGVPLSNNDNNNNNNQQDEESPRRYIESDVNIHYKTPIRYEFKDPISDSELAYRQAEQMKKLYQEERRRKYLQELQDMSNRRHTDNFIPSQKSPIALNRYDDFGPDASLLSPNSTSSRIVARALYNFHGQSARELSFKKGDIIYIRREIDKNWYEGEHNAMLGLLPSNYVEIISKDGHKVTPKKSTDGQARAKFNFHAQSAIELSLNKGELVSLTRRVDDNWFEGRIANRKGIFPVSYVDVLTDIGCADVTPILISTKPVGTPAAHSLTLAPNTTTHQEYHSRTNFVTDLSNGIIPTNGGYPSPNVLHESKTVQKTEVLHVDTNSEPMAFRAIYKYRPQNTDELELHEGDVVYVLEKCDDGWFVGTSQRTGYFGTFPGNYVEKM